MLRDVSRRTLKLTTQCCRYKGDTAKVIMSSGPEKFRKHRKTYDAESYQTSYEALDAAALSSDISPEGERYVNKLVLSMKGSCYTTLKSYFMYADYAAKCLEIKTTYEPGNLVTGVYTVNRSPFVHGKHMDRFKRDIWNRKLILHEISGTTSDVYLSYVERNLPPSVTMSVTEERLCNLNMEFLNSFYDQTNQGLYEEIGGDNFVKVRGVVAPVSRDADVSSEEPHLLE